MNILIYSVKDFEQEYLLKANNNQHHLSFTDKALSKSTTDLARNNEVVVIFAGDDASEAVVEKLHEAGVKYIAVRAAGYDNVSIPKARALGMKVANVPEYSPYAIAEHAVALMLALNRKLITANKQVHLQNFTVGNLIGFDLHQKTAGIIGTGRIGSIVAKILHGFGCHLKGCDMQQNKELISNYNLDYTDLHSLCGVCDIVMLCTPLNESTRYLINKETLDRMRDGVMLINTSRGGVLNTAHVIAALDTGKIGYLGLDVYENEKGVFFYDHSRDGVKDELLEKILGYPNVIVTPHQAFATKEALSGIAATTFYNIDCWAQDTESDNELTI